MDELKKALKKKDVYVEKLEKLVKSITDRYDIDDFKDLIDDEEFDMQVINLMDPSNLALVEEEELKFNNIDDEELGEVLQFNANTHCPNGCSLHIKSQ